MIKFVFFKKKLLLKILSVIILLSMVYMLWPDNFSTALTTKNVSTDSNVSSVSSKNLTPLYPAPAIAGISEWINSKPLVLDELKGKVILIDFWAYSCIKCVRTIPYLNAWYEKYRDKGFVILGVHSPEFDFEKENSNVKKAVESYKIQYPIALDNNFETWRNFHNRYWPAQYLIDKEGNVVYEHFGEGNYSETENNIRSLLGMNKAIIHSIAEKKSMFSPTPETYLGYNRAATLSSPEAVTKDTAARYSYSAELAKDAWALNGEWIISPEKIVSAQANASLKIRFYGSKVFAVMGSRLGKPIKVNLLLDGKRVKTNSNFDVTHHALYTLVSKKRPIEAVLEVTATEPGLEIYTFTFGN